MDTLFYTVQYLQFNFQILPEEYVRSAKYLHVLYMRKKLFGLTFQLGEQYVRYSTEDI